jgi:hypothetical protein
VHLVGSTEHTNVDVFAGDMAQHNTGQDSLFYLAKWKINNFDDSNHTVGIARPQAILLIIGLKDEIAGDLTSGPT